MTETNIKEIENKKRTKKETKEAVELETKQTKFFVDLSKDEKSLEKIFSILARANSKTYGREILFKDLVLYAVEGITDKDIEKLKDSSLTEMERVQRHLDEHNQKNGTTLSLGEFLIKKLNLN